MVVTVGAIQGADIEPALKVPRFDPGPGDVFGETESQMIECVALV